MEIPGPIKITVRDGRFGRDPQLVTDEGGEVLREFESDRLYTEGDRLTLNDGVEVEVIGVKETFSSTGVTQTLYVGDVV